MGSWTPSDGMKEGWRGVELWAKLQMRKRRTKQMEELKQNKKTKSKQLEELRQKQKTKPKQAAMEQDTLKQMDSDTLEQMEIADSRWARRGTNQSKGNVSLEQFFRLN